MNGQTSQTTVNQPSSSTTTEPNSQSNATNQEETKTTFMFSDEDALGGTPDNTPNPNEFEIKYNGQVQKLPREKVVELAQKGMNYDHVFQEKEALKNSPTIKALAEVAKQQGFDSVDAYVDALRQTTEQAAAEKRIRELETQGYDREHAKYVAELEAKAKIAQAQPPKSEDKKMAADFDEMVAAYPELREIKSFDELPESVRSAMQGGEKPIVAYSKYLAEKAAEEKRLAEQNASAKLRDTGSFKSSDDTGKDDFLSGLFKK